MRALFLCRILANGTPDLPPMFAAVEDHLAYPDGNRGGYVRPVSPIGLQWAGAVNWTNNVAIYLVRAPDDVIQRMKVAVNARWFWVTGNDGTDDDGGPDDSVDPPSDGRALAFKAWLKAAVNASTLSAARKTNWRTEIDALVIATEGKIGLLACQLCGTTPKEVKQGMIA
jgi:hypothetical protein